MDPLKDENEASTKNKKRKNSDSASGARTIMAAPRSIENADVQTSMPFFLSNTIYVQNYKKIKCPRSWTALYKNCTLQASPNRQQNKRSGNYDVQLFRRIYNFSLPKTTMT